jgi:hypothetical protein
MSLQDFGHGTSAFSNAVLAAEVSRTLHIFLSKGEGKKRRDPETEETAKRGAELLERMVQGSIALGYKTKCPSGLTPSTAGLREYGHALSALERIETASHHQRSGDLLMKYREQLLQVARGKESPSPSALKELYSFFRVLYGLFYAEVRKPLTMTPPAAFAQWRK